MESKCLCGKTFQKNRPDHLHCSHRCGSRAWYIKNRLAKSLQNSEKLLKERQGIKGKTFSFSDAIKWVSHKDKVRNGLVSFEEVTIELPAVAEALGFSSNVDYLSPGKYYYFLWRYSLSIANGTFEGIGNLKTELGYFWTKSNKHN